MALTSPWHRVPNGRGLIGLLYMALLTLCAVPSVSTADDPSYITTDDGMGYFPLSTDGQPAPLYVHAGHHVGVLRAARNLQTDMGRVTGTAPSFRSEAFPDADTVVLIGTLGRSPSSTG